MVKAYLCHISIITRSSLASKNAGKLILRLIIDELGVTPDFYGDAEPFRTPFDADKLDEVLEFWEEGWFGWKCRGGHIEGFMGRAYGRTGIHGAIDILSRPTRIDSVTSEEFAKALSRNLDVVFGFIHMLNETDIELARQNRTLFEFPSGRNYQLSLRSKELNRYIPDLYWATIFGPPYIHHFGLERLLSAPAHRVEQVSKDTVFMKLSDHYDSIITDTEHYLNVKAEVKAHLNCDAFFDPKLGRSHKYNVPKLIFPEKE